jgi:hypothetical protein
VKEGMNNMGDIDVVFNHDGKGLWKRLIEKLLSEILQSAIVARNKMKFFLW